MAFIQQNPVSIEDLRKIAEFRGFKLNSQDEPEFLSLAQDSQDAINFVLSLPDFVDPRLVAIDDVSKRTYTRPSQSDNPLNAWSHRTEIKSTAETAQSGLLSGRTIAIKDCISVAGVPLTNGTHAYHLSKDKPYPIPSLDAPVVSRVLAAGATITGTATCESYCVSVMSFTSATGPVENPWLKGYSTGGSSSGPAALLALGVARRWKQAHNIEPEDLGEGVDLAVGADQGGSIRLPSAYCGIYGLKPTRGLVPYTGAERLHPISDHAGPMATSIRDLAVLLHVLAGYDGFDPYMTPETPLRANVPLYHELLDSEIASRTAAGTWTPTTAAAGLKVGILKESLEVPGLDLQVVLAIRAAAARFAELGGEVHEVSVPQHAYGGYVYLAAGRVLSSDSFLNPTSADLPYPFLTDAAPLDQTWYEETVRTQPQAVLTVLSGEYTRDRQRYPGPARRKILSHVHELALAYDAALSAGGFDVLITPANPTVGLQNLGRDDLGVKAKADFVVSTILNTCPFNITGHPGLVIPVGWGQLEDGKGKLPIGMQIVGRKWGEAKMFQAAAAWEVGGLGLDG